MKGHALLVLTFAASGCLLGPAPQVAPLATHGDYCATQHPIADVDAPPDAEQAPAPEAIKRGFSPRAIDTARAIGAVKLLERLAKGESDKAAEEDIIDFRAQLIDAIQMAQLDLASTSAELECEQERATQVASALRTAEAQQTRNITTDSLIVTASAAIAAGILSIEDKDPAPSAIVGIGGGGLGGGLGLATLAVHRTIEFKHTRNVLGELWTGQSHPDFPQSVWTYLTRREFTDGERSRREMLIIAWRDAERFTEAPNDPQRALLFGGGGRYDADGLEDRAAMLDELEAAVSLMNHELQHLATEASQR